ncbi:MAG: hypothetical protein AAFX10_07420 [Pseudomonadota bacterium]
MKGTAKAKVAVCFGCALLAGCAVARNTVVDSVVGFPAVHVISDVMETSDDYERETQEQRAEALTQEFEEFSNSQIPAEAPDDDRCESLVVMCGDDFEAWPAQ